MADPATCQFAFSTVTSRNTLTHIPRRRSTRITTPNNRTPRSEAIFAASVRGSSPLSSTRKIEFVVGDGQRTGPDVPVEPVPVEPVPVEPVPVEPVPVEPVPVDPVPVEPVPVDPEEPPGFEWLFPDGPGLVARGTGNSGAVIRSGVGRVIGIVGDGKTGEAELPGSDAGGTNGCGSGWRSCARRSQVTSPPGPYFRRSGAGPAGHRRCRSARRAGRVPRSSSQLTGILGPIDGDHVGAYDRGDPRAHGAQPSAADASRCAPDDNDRDRDRPAHPDDHRAHNHFRTTAGHSPPTAAFDHAALDHPAAHYPSQARRPEPPAESRTQSTVQLGTVGLTDLPAEANFHLHGAQVAADAAESKLPAARPQCTGGAGPIIG